MSYLKPSLFFSFSFFFTASYPRSFHVLFRNLIGRLPMYFPSNMTIVRCSSSLKQNPLTIHFFHCLHEVLGTLKTNKAISFCLLCILIPDNLGLQEALVFRE